MTSQPAPNPVRMSTTDGQFIGWSSNAATTTLAAAAKASNATTNMNTPAATVISFAE
ncbi:hypothetical protein [Kibdelosporangium aridum]|uniref:hypothetical protein n=1 Tax=Kibdelosporangium aridum TaxID=2030 RepID=UPI0035E4F37F